ncbi:MAG: porin family protein [Opitutaceae bacterium]|jgi:opacity protein-like surface antigen|nr:porin family protein [Opitutaceae bacterium]
MKTTTASKRIISALLIALGATLAATAQTAPPAPKSVAPNYTPPKNDPRYYYQDEIQSRAHTWDFYVSVGAMLFDDIKMNRVHIYDRRDDVTRFGNLKLNLDDSFVTSIGFGYNITDKFSAGAEFSYAWADYDGSFVDTGTNEHFRLWGDADIYTGNAFAQYNFLAGKFTPFVRGNIGFMYIDTGIPTERWGRWGHGYYSDNRTQDDTFFSLGATAGLRYEFSQHVFGTLSYTANWVDTPSEWTINQKISVSVGWNY